MRVMNWFSGNFAKNGRSLRHPSRACFRIPLISGRRLVATLSCIGLTTSACQAVGRPEPGLPAAARLADKLSEHVRFLSADALGGREPGGPGEPATLRYISERLQEYGVMPASGRDWYQAVGLVSIAPGTGSAIRFGEPDRPPAALPRDARVVTISPRGEATAMLSESKIVFAGYGISAPAIGHDDYAGVDIRGKTVLLLPWTPPSPQFAGSARYEYGLSFLKVAEAARRGAAAVLIVVSDEEWEATQAAFRRPRVAVREARGPALAVEGRIARSAADVLLNAASLDLAPLTARALQPGFRALEVPIAIEAEVRSDVRSFTSHNVVGVLPGTERTKEHVILMAHWDAFGRCAPDSTGDAICNGAVDNASGVAGLIEAARLISGSRSRRSVVFLATTAEERGMLGATHYVRSPIFPLGDAVGGVSLDMIAGRAVGVDFVLFGRGLSSLDAYFEQAAAAQGRRIATPRDGEAGQFERSDNIEFVRRGVPVLLGSGLWAEGPGREAFDAYEATRYHQPSDEASAISTFEGAAQDVELIVSVAVALANSPTRPSWTSGSPYRRPVAGQGSSEQEAGQTAARAVTRKDP